MEDEMLKQLGRKIRQERESKDLSQTQLAAEIGTSQAAISLLENGEQEPGLPKLRRICKALEVSLDDLVNEEVEVETQEK